MASIAPDQARVPPDIFTRAPNPLDLTPRLADATRASKTIGRKGGTLKATGPDGTRFTLKIPKDVLPVAMTIAMTPLEDLTGFPTEATPRHHIGVQIEPDGLELARPARLTIRPPDGFPDTGVVAMDYEADGQEAGFHLSDMDRRQMTVSIDHFSGYTAEFQLEVDQIRQFAEFKRTDPARELESRIAQQVSQDQQRQRMGLETLWETPLELATAYLPLFVELVLNPRLAAAGRGCKEARAAMKAILSYQRQRQELGVGDDPSFDIKGGTNVPARLIDLTTRLCFREAYQDCSRTGDFPWLANYIFAAFRQGQLLLATEPTTEQIELATGYLRRCGHYRVEATARQIGQADIDVRLDIDLEWQPGTGEWGILGSSITGSADQVVDPLPVTRARCPAQNRRRSVLSLRPMVPAEAEVEHLAFFRIAGGYSLRTRQPIPPEPRKLHLMLDFGLMKGRTNCDHDSVNESGGPLLWFLWAYVAMAEGGATTTNRGLDAKAVDKVGWIFGSNPLTATKHYEVDLPKSKPGTINGTELAPGEAHRVEIDLLLTHTPG